ncbi:dipeptide transport ATP-binding protein DppD [Vibrio maritimus]|uniref:Dipeptide transport ATP-binding protein DppD n=1 Tax=Vibrio maritimus TaxID=990268 RepID=A0A090S4T3_9VIBR|nr:dipeptide transport ATP-binding protein DppD [Vibrio maritimus]
MDSIFQTGAENCQSSRGLVMSLLEVKDLRIEYPSRHGVHAAVKNLSFNIDAAK